MTQTEWRPSDQDFIEASEAYIRFASGIAAINNPEQVQAIHARTFEPENYEAIVTNAETSILEGIRGVIRYSNQPERRVSMHQMEHSFVDAAPIMREMVAVIYEQQGQRLDDLNPAFYALRPAPFCSQALYASICHSNLHKISTRQAMAPFLPHPKLDPLLAGRSLSGAARKIPQSRSQRTRVS